VALVAAYSENLVAARLALFVRNFLASIISFDNSTIKKKYSFFIKIKQEFFPSCQRSWRS
jgi:hypothetical protein